MLNFVSRVAGDVLTLDEVKAHLRLLTSDHDAELTILINAAVQSVSLDDFGQGPLGFPILEETWDYTIDAFSGNSIKLPIRRVTEIVSIEYNDVAGDPQTLADSVYELFGKTSQRDVRLINGQSWPNTSDDGSAITVRFKSGASSSDTVLEDIKQALKMIVAHLFENREAVVDAKLSEMPMGVRHLLRRYTRFGAY